MTFIEVIMDDRFARALLALVPVAFVATVFVGPILLARRDRNKKAGS